MRNESTINFLKLLLKNIISKFPLSKISVKYFQKEFTLLKPIFDDLSNLTAIDMKFSIISLLFFLINASISGFTSKFNEFIV